MSNILMWPCELYGANSQECHDSTSTSSSSSSSTSSTSTSGSTSTTAVATTTSTTIILQPTPCSKTYYGPNGPEEIACSDWHSCPGAVSAGSTPNIYPEGCSFYPTYPPTSNVSKITVSPVETCSDFDTKEHCAEYQAAKNPRETTVVSMKEQSPVDSSSTTTAMVGVSRTLPPTGGEVSAITSLGLLAIPIGAILVLVTRRRAHALRNN